MRGEIKRLHQEISTTMIYVTHDQIEAMTLADRIVLMRDGQIEQEGAPLDLFERPSTIFVAGFLGSPQMNFLRGTLVCADGGIAVRVGDGGVTLPVPKGRCPAEMAEGSDVILGVRPEHAGRAGPGAAVVGTARVPAVIELVQPTGSRTYATFRLAGEAMVAELEAHDVSRPGEHVAIDIDLRRASLFDPRSGRTL
jgi:multiple sugar transport system ATP-binding protein